MLDHEGRVAEASSANVFAWLDDRWCTPPLDVGILSGITRKTLLGLCRAQGVPAEERVLWPKDLARANEIFLCSSVRELVPVTKLDDAVIAGGRAGAETRKLTQLFRAEVVRRTRRA